MSEPSTPLQGGRTKVYRRKQEAIVAAAAGVFNRKGLRGATLADVAEIVGLSGNSITYYYRFKEDLAADCFLRAIDRLQALAESALRHETVEDRVKAFFRGWFDLLAGIHSGSEEDLINFYDLQALAESHAEKVNMRFVKLARMCRKVIFDPGLALTPNDFNARGHLLLSLAFGSRNWIELYDLVDYQRAGERLADILLNGILEHHLVNLPGSAVLPEAADSDSRSPTSRDSFLRAATSLINEHGYRGASVDKIAAALGVTKGSFYHHIDAKDDLIGGCFERTCTIMRQAQTLAAARVSDHADRLVWATTALVRFQLSSNGPLLRYTALGSVPEEGRPHLIRLTRRLAQTFAGTISDGIADGTIRRIDPLIAAQMVDTTINATTELTIWTTDMADDDRLEAYLVPLLLGLLPRMAPAS